MSAGEVSGFGFALPAEIEAVRERARLRRGACAAARGRPGELGRAREHPDRRARHRAREGASAKDLARRFSLRGRVALVTGASGVLGGRFAETLAGAGAAVVLAARRVEPMERLRDRIAEAGGKATVVALDVTDAGSVAAAFDAAEGALGTVDVVVNNSGIAEPGSALHLPGWRQP